MPDSDFFSGGSEHGGVFTGIGAKNITREPTQIHPTYPMVREPFSPVGSTQGLTLHPKQEHLKHLCRSFTVHVSVELLTESSVFTRCMLGAIGCWPWGAGDVCPSEPLSLRLCWSSLVCPISSPGW